MVVAMAAGGVLAEDFDAFYVGSSVGAFMPDGAARPRNATQVAARAGWYSSDTLAWEASLGSNLRGKAGNVAAGSLGLLWHWWGFERFDPFFTCGIGFARRSFGPGGGVGAFWHMTERASLRFGYGMVLDAADGCAPLHSIEAGIQFSF